MNRDAYRRSLSAVTGFSADDRPPIPSMLTEAHTLLAHLAAPSEAEKACRRLAGDSRVRSATAVEVVTKDEFYGASAEQSEVRLRLSSEQAQHNLCMFIRDSIAVDQRISPHSNRNAIEFIARITMIEPADLLSLLLDAYQLGKESR